MPLKRHGVIWLYSSIFFELPRLLPELIFMWLKTRNRHRFVPFLDFEPLLDRSLLEIRQEFDLLPFIKNLTGAWNKSGFSPGRKSDSADFSLLCPCID